MQTEKGQHKRMPEQKKKRGMPDGMTRLKLMQEKRSNVQSMTDLMDVELDAFDRGWARLLCHPGEKHRNPSFNVHGGYGATVLDGVMGWALISTLAEEEVFTTIDLNIKYLRAMKADGTVYVAHGKVIDTQGRTVITDGTIVDPDGRICVYGTATCRIVRPRS